MGTIALSLLLFGLLVVGTAVALSVTGRLPARSSTGGEGRGPARPWWGNPLVWLGVMAGSLLLGGVVAPKLLGGVVLFLPFFWVRGLRRRPGPESRERHP
ncbi:MAG TPA: hypothetical protein VE646_06625 [Actinomycetota bacterium]|nr:hypothetical protein [Actinomycetota bacterium]